MRYDQLTENLYTDGDNFYVVTIDTLFNIVLIVLHFQRSKTIWDMVASE